MLLKIGDQMIDIGAPCTVHWQIGVERDADHHVPIAQQSDQDASSSSRRHPTRLSG